MPHEPIKSRSKIKCLCASDETAGRNARCMMGHHQILHGEVLSQGEVHVRCQ